MRFLMICSRNVVTFHLKLPLKIGIRLSKKEKLKSNIYEGLTHKY
jgi:hypothetical protein